MPDSEADFQAQMDLETLVRANEIKRDDGRVARARDFANRRADELKRMGETLPERPVRSFNGAVRNRKRATR